MSLRRRSLPRGWYPDEPETLRKLVSSWTVANRGAGVTSRGAGVASRGAGVASHGAGAVAAVAPHAGWSFSGRLAAEAAASLERTPTVAIFGGHLPGGARPLAARESDFESPQGPLEVDAELLSALDARIDLGADDEPDNTVEVLLPIVALLFPGSRLLWLRAPNDVSSLELGAALFDAAASVGRRVACLGSTDLTHYGPNYSFVPKGRGVGAEAWVKGTNDKRFIDALLAMDGVEAIARAETDRSACSAGAAAAALAFARAAGATRARLLDYSTSLEVRSDDSFVGYAAIAFYKEPA